LLPRRPHGTAHEPLPLPRRRGGGGPLARRGRGGRRLGCLRRVRSDRPGTAEMKKTTRERGSRVALAIRTDGGLRELRRRHPPYLMPSSSTSKINVEPGLILLPGGGR